MGMPFAAMVVMASTGVGAVAGGLGFNAAMWQDKDFSPKLWGWDIRPIFIGAGLIAPFLFGPMLGGLLFGLAASSLVSFDTSMRTKEAADEFLAQQQLDSPARPQIEDSDAKRAGRRAGKKSRWLDAIVAKLEEEAA